MKTVIFEPIGNPLQFPDDPALFSDITQIRIGGIAYVKATYSGSLSLTEYVEDARAKKLKELNAWHDAQTEAIKAKYSKAEIDSFLDKRNEALAYRKDNTVQTPYIMAMAGGDNTVRIALINAILAKIDTIAQIESYVFGKRDAIEAATTHAALNAIII